ncbi:MAG: N-acetylmuramoyl-L-alanine amidase [Bacteroidaceae bacterium]|nr:N-acetylmuramoyl-L-alanine amidase [Bacteroidaceae bacterium]
MKPLIIIDNGHGVNTPGKRSPVWPDGSQLLEGRWTRNIARDVVERLLLLGYDARLLVPEERDVPLTVRIKRAREWVCEHKQRGGIAAQRLMVSIHANASAALPTADDAPSSSRKPSGWEAFMHGSDANCRELGCELYRKALELLPERFPIRTRSGNARRGIPLFPKRAEFYLLAYAPCVAILTENLFMDNADDCRYLLSDEGRRTIVQLHVRAIDDYLRKRL